MADDKKLTDESVKVVNGGGIISDMWDKVKTTSASLDNDEVLGVVKPATSGPGGTFIPTIEKDKKNDSII